MLLNKGFIFSLGRFHLYCAKIGQLPSSKYVLRLKEKDIILISGSGRSGTTILKSILSAHEAVASMPEWFGLIGPDGPLDYYVSMKSAWSPHLSHIRLQRLQSYLSAVGYNSKTLKGASILLQKLGKDPFRSETTKRSPSYFNVDASSYCPDYSSLCQTLITRLKDFDFNGMWLGEDQSANGKLPFSGYKEQSYLAESIATFYKGVAKSIAQSQGATLFVDDNTASFLWLNHIQEIMPSIKLIHVYRDPRDVVSSYLEQRWAPNNVELAANYYQAIMSRWEYLKSIINTENVFEIALESLLNNPEVTLKRITAFIGLQWDRQLLDIDLSKGNIGRWENDLSKDDLERILPIIEPSLRNYNYE